jgi:hypothetical protein
MQEKKRRGRGCAIVREIRGGPIRSFKNCEQKILLNYKQKKGHVINRDLWMRFL